ncbi:hypothetical protein BS78_02G155500 [Paspalum vaginatum]|nr:hypothetical protein BS78_02G155500 [Paspalum vaginatum]
MSEDRLVDILKDHVNIPMYKGQNGWITEGWRSITQKFNDRFPEARFPKQQVREKERELKANYKMIRDAKNSSGVGWNESLGMLIAEPRIWDELIKVDKKIGKFRKKPFPLYNDVASLHEGNVAIGDLNFTSTQGGAPPSARYTHAPPAQTTHAPPPARTTHAPPPARTTPVPPSAARAAPAPPSAVASLTPAPPSAVPSATSSPHKETIEGGSRRKRRQNHIGSVLEDYVEFKKEQTSKAMNAIDEKRRREEEYCVEKCLEELDAMDGLIEANREMFMKSKNHKARLIWLKRKIAYCWNDLMQNAPMESNSGMETNSSSLHCFVI